MKAAVFKAPGAPLVIEDVPEPRPGPTDLILKVRACGICGTDLHWSESRDGSAGWRALAPETVMGHEFAGEVVEVGSRPARPMAGRRAGDRAALHRLRPLPGLPRGAGVSLPERRDAGERRAARRLRRVHPGRRRDHASGCPNR